MPARDSGFERWTAALSPALVARRAMLLDCRTRLSPSEVGGRPLIESHDEGVTLGWIARSELTDEVSHREPFHAVFASFGANGRYLAAGALG
jgi:hypothetical protein